jgi:hypothetical protein
MSEDELEDAVARGLRNRAGRWPERGTDSRLEPECWPELKPRFHLVPGSTVFTIGSCFARSVEVCLEQLGFNVPTRTFVKENRALMQEAGDEILNKYTPPSIWQELSWTKRIRDRDGIVTEADIEPLLLELDNGNVVDLQRRFANQFGIGRAEALAQRRVLYRLFETVFDSDVVVITLGLIECWLDRTTGQFIEFGNYLRKHNGRNRFAFKRLGFQEAYEFTKKSIDLINGIGRANILLTTSPVPLARTFTEDDVIVANMHSKSVLRAVAGQIAEEYPNVDYFPSYENVMLTKQTYVWANDLTHVEPEFVNRIMTRLSARYVGDSGSPPDVAATDDRLRIANLVSHRRFDEARDLYQRLPEAATGAADGAFFLAFAEMQLHFGETAAAVATAGKIRDRVLPWGERACATLLRCAAIFETAGDADAADNTRAWVFEHLRNAAIVKSLIRRSITSGAPDEARRIIAHIESRLADHLDLLDFAARSYETLGDLDAAIRVCRLLLKANAGHSDTLMRLGDLYLRQDKPRRAAAVLSRARTADPGNAVVFEKLVSLLFQLKLLDDAETQARAFIVASPLNPLGHLYLASALRQLRRRPEALEHAKRAAELEPGDNRYSRYLNELSKPARGKAG